VRSTNRRGWQMERRDDVPLSEVMYILWERRLLVAGVVLVLTFVALLFVSFRGPIYTAEATVNVEPMEELTTAEEGQAFLDEVRLAVVTNDWLRGVMRRAEWEGEPREFRERLESEDFVQGGETKLRVRFSGSSPEQAARAANAYAELFVERVERLNDERLAGGTLPANASVEQRAASSGSWSALRLLLYAVVAAGLGVLAGGAAALLLEGRARSWRDARDVELTLRAPVLGVIPDYSSVEEEG
jgi:capsular polysaccharide biosynthesis protein